MTYLRITPPKEFVYEIVSIFTNKPIMNSVQEIRLCNLNKTNIIEKITALYPALEFHYFPCKLKQLLCKYKCEKTGKDITGFTFDKCITILRQILRGAGYKVQTRMLRKNLEISGIIVIIPMGYLRV